jgi:hypothetical protein
MEGAEAGAQAQDRRSLQMTWDDEASFRTGNGSPRRPAREVPVWHDWGLLAVLLALAAAIHAWLIGHTEVAARDSIGYIRYAWQLQHQPWADVLRQSDQHPGYPVALLAVSLPVRHFLGGPESLTMQLSAQLTSTLAGVLLVIPMFYLGGELFDRAVGFWAAALFQCLPASARVMADGLSEATFLLFAATALWLAARALRGSSPVLFGLCGLFGGLAYLTRPEGALIVAATGLVLLAMQGVPGWGRPWFRSLGCAAGLALAALAVAGPFVAVTGRLTTKPTGQRILETAHPPGGEGRSPAEFDPAQPRGLAGSAGAGTARPTLLASTLAVWWREKDGSRLWWGLRALGREVVQGFHHVAWLPALLGLWWFRGRLRVVPGAWAVLLVCLFLGLLLWRVAALMGYLSDRHTLLLILCGTFWAVAAMAAIGSWLARVLGSRLAGRVPGVGGRFWSILLLLLLTGSGLPRTLQPLHTNRAGHHAAGLWLANHTAPTDTILDPYCWAHYYAGRVFLEGTTPEPPSGANTARYVVFERAGREHSRLPMVPEAERLVAHGRLVYHWPTDRPADKAVVFVYAVP